MQQKQGKDVMDEKEKGVRILLKPCQYQYSADEKHVFKIFVLVLSKIN